MVSQNSSALNHTHSFKTNGILGATIVAGAVGCLVIGLMTTGAVISEGLKNFLNWWSPAGPLSGKTGLGIISWLAAWAVLHIVWKNKEMPLKSIMTISLVLIALGFILTFPPVFEAFEH